MMMVWLVPFAGTQASKAADIREAVTPPPEGDDELTCEQLKEIAGNPLWDLESLENRIKAAQAASWVLMLECPPVKDTSPVTVLHKFVSEEFGAGFAAVLGAIYEHGVRVDRDLDGARYWFRRFVFSLAPNDEGWLKNWQDRIKIYNPKIRAMSEEEGLKAISSDQYDSKIFADEWERYRKLMNGPVDDIIKVAQHLYHGTGGYPQSDNASYNILKNAADRGYAEAHYALALGYLNRHYNSPLPLRDDQVLWALRHLTSAASKKYLPAILKLAAICEDIDKSITALNAIALLELAKENGTQGLDERIARLRQNWPPGEESWIAEETENIARGISPPCN